MHVSKWVKVHAPVSVDAKGRKPDYKKDDFSHGDIRSSLWNGSHKYEHCLRVLGPGGQRVVEAYRCLYVMHSQPRRKGRCAHLGTKARKKKAQVRGKVEWALVLHRAAEVRPKRIQHLDQQLLSRGGQTGLVP